MSQSAKFLIASVVLTLIGIAGIVDGLTRDPQKYLPVILGALAICISTLWYIGWWRLRRAEKRFPPGTFQ